MNGGRSTEYGRRETNETNETGAAGDGWRTRVPVGAGSEGHDPMKRADGVTYVQRRSCCKCPRETVKKASASRSPGKVEPLPLTLHSRAADLQQSPATANASRGRGAWRDGANPKQAELPDMCRYLHRRLDIWCASHAPDAGRREARNSARGRSQSLSPLRSTEDGAGVGCRGRLSSRGRNVSLRAARYRAGGAIEPAGPEPVLAAKTHKGIEAGLLAP